MNKDEYLKDANVLYEFFSFYCANKHLDVKKEIVVQPLIFKENNYGTHEPLLCLECAKTYKYANERLSECRLNPKPKCRKCEVRCYDKEQWKQMAKVMRYSGLGLGYVKMKKRLFDIFEKINK